MIKRKTSFFHFGTAFNTPWLQKNKFYFYWTTTLTTLWSWKNVLFLFHWDVHYGNIFLHDLTSLATSLTCRKNSQTVYSPEKTYVCNLKNNFSQEFQWSLTWFTFPIPSSGVSTTSFNTSSTLAIIFIKCRNRYQMKNNARYKGNTNNTYITIFLKNSQRW